jgi:outer membrane protein assembly factor BamE
MPVPSPLFCCPRVILLGIVCALALGLGACQSLQTSDNVVGLVTPYRVEVVQGNVVTQEQMALIQPGMTRNQVRDVLGSPLLTDIFHADRWDYIFTINRQGTEPQRRLAVLQFEGDKLKRVEAPELPPERAFVASIDTFKAPRKAPELSLSEEQLKALPAPKAGSVNSPAQAAESAPPRQYPALEESLR